MKLTNKARVESGSSSRDQQAAETTRAVQKRNPDRPLVLMAPVLGLEVLSWFMGHGPGEAVLWAQLALTLACLVWVVVARFTATGYPP